jgi:hypothetical protein
MRIYALPQRDSRYLEFIRELPCTVRSCHLDSEAHHAKLDWRPASEGGMSQKGSDYCAIALCHAHHMELHQTGPDAFELKYGIEIDRAIASNLIHYLTRTRRKAR